MQIQIDHRFTTLNEYVDAERTNRFIAAKIKREETERAYLAVREYENEIGKSNLKWLKYPAEIKCHWFAKTKRCDPDNISFAIKFILDGFVLAGLFSGDGWKQIKSISHTFTQATHDYVIVEVK